MMTGKELLQRNADRYGAGWQSLQGQLNVLRQQMIRFLRSFGERPKGAKFRKVLRGMEYELALVGGLNPQIDPRAAEGFRLLCGRRLRNKIIRCELAFYLADRAEEILARPDTPASVRKLFARVVTWKRRKPGLQVKRIRRANQRRRRREDRDTSRAKPREKAA